MMRECTVTLDFEGVKTGTDVVGMLIPVAGSHTFQRCNDIRIPSQSDFTKIEDLSGIQSALFVSGESVSKVDTVEYDFASTESTQGAEESTSFQVGSVSEWTRSLGYDLQNLNLNEQQRRCKATCAQAAVDYIGDKFDYVSQSARDELTNLSCDLVTGNCIDINNGLMALLSDAEIEHCYFSGIYFPEHSNTASHGWHCWVATRESGRIHYWDIAQHLKSGESQIRPGLNPVGGRRFAFSQGTDLVFEINDTRFTLKKFPFPTILFNDGTSELLLPNVTLTTWN